ncbi:Uncharacterised protein [Actinobacillus pleuropneumoniae]|nr:Uncharacterised protein [Actinobacillus pleuropneumoniae]
MIQPHRTHNRKGRGIIKYSEYNLSIIFNRFPLCDRETVIDFQNLSGVLVHRGGYRPSLQLNSFIISRGIYNTVSDMRVTMFTQFSIRDLPNLKFFILSTSLQKEISFLSKYYAGIHTKF